MLSRLVGDALCTTLNGPAEFSRDWLNRCLLGSPGARSLRLSAPHADSARRAAVEALQRGLTTSLGISKEDLVRRDRLLDLGDELARHPIVLVLGGGGCGKSTLACAVSTPIGAVLLRRWCIRAELDAHWLGGSSTPGATLRRGSLLTRTMTSRGGFGMPTRTRRALSWLLISTASTSSVTVTRSTFETS